MKKTLIALAVLAASGASFAQVTITGALISGYQATTDGVTKNDSSGFGTDTSEIFFKATEELGGGWKVSATMGLAGADRSGESGTGVTAGTVNGRNSSLALTTPVGVLGLASTRAADYMSTIAGVGGYGNNFDGKVLSARTNRDVVSFAAPVGPVTLAVSYQEQTAVQGLGVGTTGDAVASTGQSLTTWGATYAQGPVAANFTYLNFNSKVGRTKDQTRLSGSYDLGVVKLGLGAVVTNSDATIAGINGGKATDLLFGARAPMGNVGLGLNLVQRKIDDVAFTGQGVGTISGAAYQVDYAMSKRTSVVANYARWTASNGADASSQFNLLLAHSF